MKKTKQKQANIKTSCFVVWLPEQRRPQQRRRRTRVSVRVQWQRSRRRHGDQLSWCLLLASDVLLLGEGVGRHSRGRGRGQALHRGVFEDSRGVRRRREGVFGRGGAGAAAGGRGGVGVVGLLRQEGQRRVDGRRVGFRVVLLVARQSVTHVVGRVWQFLVEPPWVLQQRGASQNLLVQSQQQWKANIILDLMVGNLNLRDQLHRHTVRRPFKCTLAPICFSPNFTYFVLWNSMGLWKETEAVFQFRVCMLGRTRFEVADVIAQRDVFANSLNSICIVTIKCKHLNFAQY